ncbi:unnamed protein product [Musa banksii]
MRSCAFARKTGFSGAYPDKDCFFLVSEMDFLDDELAFRDEGRGFVPVARKTGFLGASPDKDCFFLVSGLGFLDEEPAFRDEGRGFLPEEGEVAI